MPELPEVETTASGIRGYLEGARIEGWEIRDTRLRWPVPVQDLRSLTGECIHQVRRRGKYLLLLSGSGTQILHLGMSGTLRILEAGTESRKHDHIDMQISGGRVLRLNDPRRFGAWLMTAFPWEEHPLLAKLGPEPVITSAVAGAVGLFNGGLLAERGRARSCTIKSLLMDSQVVVGVGNIYANEALFRAGIRPSRLAGKISLARYERLAGCVQRVLEEAIQQGGTSLKDFTDSLGRPGYFSQQLQVYGRKGMPCMHCGTPVRQAALQGRATYWCPTCQH